MTLHVVGATSESKTSSKTPYQDVLTGLSAARGRTIRMAAKLENIANTGFFFGACRKQAQFRENRVGTCKRDIGELSESASRGSELAVARSITQKNGTSGSIRGVIRSEALSYVSLTRAASGSRTMGSDSLVRGAGTLSDKRRPLRTTGYLIHASVFPRTALTGRLGECCPKAPSVSYPCISQGKG